MGLRSITLGNCRNLAEATLELEPGLTLVTGCNGSGKTALLESIHLLGTGRRTGSSKIQPFITYGAGSCTVFGRVEQAGREYRLGVTRLRNGGRLLKVDGEETRRTSLLAGILPLQVLTPLTIELVNGPPVYRRRFLNWGLFHVEHQFASVWSRFIQCLRQRNALLRQGATDGDMEVWEKQLAETGAHIDAMRSNYVDSVVAAISDCAAVFNLSGALEFGYQRGWPAAESLQEVLDRTRDSDRERGFTGAGPHRADLQVRWRGRQAAETASRGEMKALSWAMRLGQGRHMEARSATNCTYLVDDLGAEFDAGRRHAILGWLQEQAEQAIVTMIDANETGDHAFAGRFHMKHGRFSKEAIA